MDLDGLVTSGAVVDMQDVFMRLTFDLTAMFVFGVDPGCLARLPDRHRLPAAASSPTSRGSRSHVASHDL